MHPALKALIDDAENGNPGRCFAPPWRDGESVTVTFDGKMYAFEASSAEIKRLAAAFEQGHAHLDHNVYTVDSSGTVIDVGR